METGDFNLYDNENNILTIGDRMEILYIRRNYAYKFWLY